MSREPLPLACHALTIGAALVMLGGCRPAPEKPASSAPPPTAAEGPTVRTVDPTPPGPDDVLVYRCQDGEMLRALYPDDDTAEIDYLDKHHTMKIVRSASGARYVGDGMQWWTKGVMQGAISPLAEGEDIASAPAVNCVVGGDGAPGAMPLAPGTDMPPPEEMPGR